MLSGKIGAYPVVMHLHKSGHTYNGYYYYQGTQQPISLLGEDTSSAGKINLFATGGGNKDGETFLFAFADGKAAGNWHLGQQTKFLAFQAAELKGQPAFRYITHKAAQPLQAAANSPARVSYDAAIVWPINNSGAGAAIRNNIMAFVANRKSSDAIDALVQQAQSSFFAAYQQEHAAAKAADIKEMPSAFTSDQTKRAMVAYSGKAFLSIALFTYAYTGGAHGNYGTQFQSFNLHTGKQLQLKEVLTAAGIRALPKLLAAAYRKREGLSASAPLTEGGLFDNKINPTDNFFVTGKVIGFNYQPYEIGPYALGEIVLYLPYSQVRTYLQPAFANALKKN